MMTPYGILLYMNEAYTEAHVVQLERMIASLAEAKVWVIEPPEFVDETEQPDSGNPEDQPVRTVGGFLELHRCYDGVDPHVERREYAATEFFVDAMNSFSARTGCAFECELGGEIIGSIMVGAACDGITVGLLGEWRKALDNEGA